MQAPTYEEAVALLQEQFSRLQLVVNENLIKDKQVEILREALISQEQELWTLKDAANTARFNEAEAKEQQLLLIKEQEAAQRRLEQAQQRHKAEAKELKEKHEAAKSELARLKEERDALQRDLDDQRDRAKESATASKGAKLELTKVKSAMKAVQNENETLKQKLEGQTMATANEEKRSKKLLQKAKEAGDQAARLRRENDQLKRRLVQLQNERGGAQGRMIAELQRALDQREAEVAEAKGTAVDLQIESRQVLAKMQGDVKYFLNCFGEGRSSQEEFKSRLKPQLLFVLKEGEKMKLEQGRLQQAKKALERRVDELLRELESKALETEQEQARAKKEKAALVRSLQLERLSFQEQVYVLQRQLQESESKERRLNVDTLNCVEQLRRQAQGLRTEAAEKIVLCQSLQAQITSLKDTLGKLKAEAAEVPRLKLQSKLYQYSVAELVRLFFLLFYRLQRAVGAGHALKEFVNYYVRVSKQIRRLEKGRGSFSRLQRFRVCVQVVATVGYLRRLKATRQRARLGEEAQLKVKQALRSLESSRLRNVLVDVMGSSECKNNLQFIGAVGEVCEGESQSISEQSRLIGLLLCKFAELHPRPREGTGFRLANDLTVKITKALTVLQGRRESGAQPGSPSSAEKSEGKPKVAGKIYGRLRFD